MGPCTLLSLTRIPSEGAVEETLERIMQRRRMLKELPKNKNHTRVCGHGRVGKELV